MTNPPILRIAITPGEPAGIGPDLCLQLAQIPQVCELVFFCDPSVLIDRANQLNVKITLKIFDANQPPSLHQPGILLVNPIALATPSVCGQLNSANSPYVLECIAAASQACLDGSFAAIVTAPVHKGIINEAKIPFTGHTEFIAEITGGHPVMMLATPGLRVALATTHLPLKEVCSAITQECLTSVIQVLEHDLRNVFGLPTPKILVCGLNPHAGESGHLGREEIDIIEPVLAKFQQQGLHINGPLPADTLFTPKYLTHTDAVLAMYHDQGLPVLKHMGFGNAVNITLGLPIIRTSVDHGTALDLAGTGLADMGSLKYALATALEMATNRL